MPEIKVMETGLRHRSRHANLRVDASKSIGSSLINLPGGAPTSIEPRPYDLPNQSDRNEIKPYVTKALVPYIKDDERPSFSGAQGMV